MSKHHHTALEDAFNYCPDTGTLVWRSGPRKHMHAGAQMVDGSIEVRFHNRLYRAHHIAWFLGHGEWPVHHIGHVNGDRGDNRLDNLFEIVSRKSLLERQDGVI